MKSIFDLQKLKDFEKFDDFIVLDPARIRIRSMQIHIPAVNSNKCFIMWNYKNQRRLKVFFKVPYYTTFLSNWCCNPFFWPSWFLKVAPPLFPSSLGPFILFQKLIKLWVFDYLKILYPFSLLFHVNQVQNIKRNIFFLVLVLVSVRNNRAIFYYNYYFCIFFSYHIFCY